MTYSIRAGTADDVTKIVELLPRLADFDIPQYRNPDHLWHGDRDMVLEWASGDRENVDVIVAAEGEAILGVAVVSTRLELLSAEPSVHLEVLAIASSAEGLGIGSALLKETESLALMHGARSISLHVFSANKRARALYERHGYMGELMRYLKPLDENK